MIATKQPKVILYNHTLYPHESIGLAVSAWTSDDFPEDVLQIEQEAPYLTAKALKAYHKVALEYVDLIFVIKNVSRAFQQQLTRTRMASYSIQSMRVVTKKLFATNGHYTMPPNLTDEQQLEFHDAMLEAEVRYMKMINDGWKAEDARGMLPLNIHSDISMKISLAALYHMLRQRFCVLTQWEYRQVATQIKALVSDELGEQISAPMDAPCVQALKCPMREEYCGIPIWKLDEKNRIHQYMTWVPENE